MKKVIFILTCGVFAFAACGKKTGSADASVSYYKSDGQCYEANTNKVVDIATCANVSYYMEYGNCYKADGTWASDATLCTNMAGAYYINNSACVEKQNSQYVSYNLCTGTGLYGQNTYGQCIQKSNGAVIADSYCDNDPNRYQLQSNSCFDTYTQSPTYNSRCSTTAAGASCYGRYAQMNQYQQITGYITCNGANCSGQTLFDPNIGGMVTCH